MSLFNQTGKFKKLGDPAAPDALTIEGYANFNAPDSVNERLDPMSVDLRRFNKNPILLFNHNMDYPCGRVVVVKPTPDGLYVKAQLSKSAVPQLQFVRDLTEEGILQTFSVRFDKETWESDPDNPGVKVAKNWELQELSIVTIPMQQDSTFTLSKAKSLFNGVTSLTEARGRVMKVKGKLVAALLNKRLAELEKQDGFNKPDFIRAFAQAASVDEPTLADIMAGKITPCPDGVIKAATEQMHIEANEISEANAQDVEAQKKGFPEADKEPKPEEKPDTKKDAAPPAPAAPPAAEGQQPTPEVSPEEKANTFVREKIAGYLKSGMEQQEAVAKAMEECKSAHPDVKFSDDQMKELLMYADSCGANQKSVGDAPSTAVQGNAPGDQQNPMLQMMQQQIALLGQLVGEIQQLKAVMTEGFSKLQQAEAAEAAEDAQEDSTELAANEDMAVMKALEKEVEVLQAKVKSMNIEEN